MNLLTLNEAKTLLGVTHSFDDERIALLMDSANAEVVSFMNRENDSTWGDSDLETRQPDDVKLCAFLLLQASYEGTTDDMGKMRNLIEHKLFPYRKGLGV